MDKNQAEQSFAEEIGGRWPDFKLSQVLMEDWLSLFSKFLQSDIKRAASQYVLNFDAYRSPSLSKFREILNSQKKFGVNKPFMDKWPQYFLQCDSRDCKYWGYGTFTSFHIDTQDPNLAMKIIEQQKVRQEEMYGGKWIIITCYDESERRVLINLRSQKNKTTPSTPARRRPQEALQFGVGTIISSVPVQSNPQEEERA